MATLKQLYTDYLVRVNATEVTLDSTSQYSCWKVVVKRPVIAYDWLGNKIPGQVDEATLYIWLGNKGAVYATKSPIFNKKERIIKSKFIDEMKRFVFKTL